MGQPRTSPRQFPVRMAACIYLAIFSAILLLAYTGRLPKFLGAIPYYDKIGHVMLYAVATYLGDRVCRHRSLPIGGWAAPLFPLLFTAFTFAEELIQQVSPNRTLAASDLVASLAGILLGWRLAQRSRFN